MLQNVDELKVVVYFVPINNKQNCSVYTKRFPIFILEHSFPAVYVRILFGTSPWYKSGPGLEVKWVSSNKRVGKAYNLSSQS